MQETFQSDASSAESKKNIPQQQQQQPSPTSVKDLTIDVNSPALDHHQSLQSPQDSKSRRNRRRRKAKARSNHVEPGSSPSRNHSSKNKNNGNNYNGNNSKAQQYESSSSFRSPIVQWRNNRPRNSNNNNNNNRHNNNHNRHNNSNNKNWNHPSPRFGKDMSTPPCPASMGFPTSKKQHDSPMKKRDLYFALHVERVGIAPPSDNESQKQQKAVARVTLTNWENEIVLDTFVAIPVPVTDFYETGIRPQDVQANNASTNTAGAQSTENSPPPTTIEGEESSRSFAAVRARVEQMLRGKILIGHQLDEGLQALGLMHPSTDTRDCSSYFSHQRNAGVSSLASLEELSRKELNRWSVKASRPRVAKDASNKEMIVFARKDSSISKMPVLVCVTCMDLYKKHRNEWETALIAQARERERQQQEHLMKISQQRQQEQQQAQQQARQQYRDGITSISMHCETVRTALSGRTRTLARVTIVDGPSRNILLDEFCQIPVPVTDFCQTGITAKDVQALRAKNDDPTAFQSKPLSLLRAHVEQVLRGRLLVGYKVEESLKALGLSHPWGHIRDTAFFPPFLHNKLVGGSTSVVTVRSLDDLSEDFLRQQLRPPGDRSRPVDLCRTALGLYETFRDQWERQPQNVYLQHSHPHPPQPQNLHPQPGRMIPGSPSASSAGMLQSPQHNQQQPNQFYGQQPGVASYGGPNTIMSPSQQHQHQHHFEQQHPTMGIQEQHHHEQKQHSDMHSRSNSSSWFPWVKHQHQQQNPVGAASQMLSPQAYQVLQEVSGGQAPPSPQSNSFFFRDNFSVSSYFGGSSYAEGTSGYDESTFGVESEMSAVNSETVATESVLSSLPDEVSNVLPDEASSIIGSDPSSSVVGSPPLDPENGSSSSSSWFRFGAKKCKYPTPNDGKIGCETMAAVQETEVLSDDGMLPTPTKLFSLSQDIEEESTKPPQKNDNTGMETGSDDSNSSASTSRNWFGLRKSSISPCPGSKERSKSPCTPLSLSTVEDLSISAQPEGFPDAATEASIEITLSIPASGESDDIVSPLTEKPGTTSLSCRPSASWFGFRRSSKSSSGSKSSNLPLDSSTKRSDQSEMLCSPALKSAPTERTAAMDDDWLQEVISHPTYSTNDFDPWLNEKEQAESVESIEKSSSTSRGQTSWFGFKRSKATSSNKATPLASALDSTECTYSTEDPHEDHAWDSDTASDPCWLKGTSNASIPDSDELDRSKVINVDFYEHNHYGNSNDIFRPRARLPTESTIPSVTTEGPSEEEASVSDGSTKDYDFGAVQSFNFLKI
mmetsp:Transcript_4411/g.10664  ORF Transcript_4411/g.10664 Transcript_4411/m.10664 type:complete len:1287 (+) Transcript_4411:764-4624(+)